LPRPKKSVVTGGSVERGRLRKKPQQIADELRDLCCRFVPKSFAFSISLITCAPRFSWIAVSMRATAHSWVASTRHSGRVS